MENHQKIVSFLHVEALALRYMENFVHLSGALCFPAQHTVSLSEESIEEETPPAFEDYEVDPFLPVGANQANSTFLIPDDFSILRLIFSYLEEGIHRPINSPLKVVIFHEGTVYT